MTMKLIFFFLLPSLIYSPLLQGQSPARLSTRPPADLPAGAAAAPAVSQSFNPLPAPTNAYVLGPEDQISIHVVDLDDLSDKPVRIDPNGFIDLPLAGRMHVAGLSVEEFRAQLAQSIAKYIDSPKITINILEYRSQPVSILGAVNTPGTHQLQGPKRLIDVISAAGGLKPDAGTKLQITREMRWGMLPLPGAHADSSGAFSTAEVLLGPLTSGQNPGSNIEVRANDVLTVVQTEIVYVVGEVKKSGGFALNAKDNISLIRALSLAEGLTHDAAPKKARILRTYAGSAEPEQIPVNLQLILAGTAPDVVLRPNDVLFIPNNVSGSALKRAAEAAIQIATGVAVFGVR
jgi:polysaccharide biosynthesis/export protein